MWLKPLDNSVFGDRQLKLTAILAKADGNSKKSPFCLTEVSHSDKSFKIRCGFSHMYLSILVFRIFRVHPAAKADCNIISMLNFNKDH
jgi:hypothetical protein